MSHISRSIKVLAKIECSESLNNLEEIVEASDGIMVARGDLGVQVPLEQIPAIQEQITNICRQLNKPVIIASQLLESMIEYPTPTRAEVRSLSLSLYLLSGFSLFFIFLPQNSHSFFLTVGPKSATEKLRLDLVLEKTSTFGVV